ncbi:MAG TPA: cysteine synthase A [Gemmatimonadaceae bacterium]|jgi:cysteine synthase A|nr:cysteine synthase A [Gemmatimonadaceae bacterium]
MRVNNILETIGNTPHVRLNRLYANVPGAEVWLKLERANPGASIKDRIGIAMIEDAERRGILKKGGVIVEPTSGNTGIAIAMAAAVKGYRCILVLPESMSIERRRVMLAYGAELVLTPKEAGTKGAIDKANEIAKATPGGWVANQFDNPANVDIHRRTTAQEILRDFPEGIDFLITGVGTGGHISGVAEVLKKTMPNLKAFAVEPVKSQPIAGGTHSPHKIQGIGTGFVPGNVNRAVIDGTVAVTEEDAFAYAQRAAREEGIFIGISSGASLAAVAQKLPEIPKGARVLTFCYDTGERYLSVDGLFPTMAT